MTNFIFSAEDYVTAGTALGGKEKCVCVCVCVCGRWGGGGRYVHLGQSGLGVAEAASSDRLL